MTDGFLGVLSASSWVVEQCGGISIVLLNMAFVFLTPLYGKGDVKSIREIHSLRVYVFEPPKNHIYRWL